MAKKIDTSTFDFEAQSEFIKGWEEAGGYMDDLRDNDRAPYCAPWQREGVIEVSGDTPAQWGTSYWEQVKDSVLEELGVESRVRPGM